MTPDRPAFWDKLPKVKDFPASDVESYDPNRYEIRWNSDYTRFIPIKLRWNDDKSYQKYQSSDTAWLEELFG